MGATTTPSGWRDVRRGAGRRALGIAAALACAAFAASAPAAQPREAAIVAKMLSAEDIERYRRVFELQERGQWRAADRVVQRLESRLLMGRVLFQRYMHPTRYRSSYRELRDWMEAYADQPGARRIHRLALRRQPAGSRPPPPPPSPALSRRVATAAEAACPSSCLGAARQRRAVRNIRAAILHQLRRGNPRRAEARLGGRDARRLLDTRAYDEMRRRVATAYFLRGDDNRALELARRAAARSRAEVPLADWTAGLASWRLGRRDLARTHFTHLAHSRSSSGWNVAAGAFWAARANLVTGRASAVNPLLEVAVEHPHTFYGLIAARLLGRDIAFDWTPPALEPAATRELLGKEAVRRAVALRQIDQIYWRSASSLSRTREPSRRSTSPCWRSPTASSWRARSSASRRACSPPAAAASTAPCTRFPATARTVPTASTERWSMR